MREIKKIKVLWFTNTPCSASEKLKMKNVYGGWLSSLEKEVSQVSYIELGICFYSNTKLNPFIFNGTQYYPVYRDNNSSKFKRFVSKFFRSNRETKEIELLLTVIKDFAPDLIHVHGTEDNFGLVQYQTSIPVAISIQGLLNPYLSKYFSGIPFEVALRNEGLVKKLRHSGIKNRIKVFKSNAAREQRILKVAKNIIGRTDWDKRVTRILSPESKYFIVNEILRDAFYNAKWEKKTQKENFVITTTIGDALYKGFETIVNTAQILVEHTNLKFNWRIIGLNENSLSAGIVRKWNGSSFKDLKIRFLNEMSVNEIINTLSESDLYVQVSHIENSPNSLCEAMLLGMPIIATNAGGTSSLLVDRMEGVLVQDGDPWSIAGAIVEVANSIDKGSAMGAKARQSATLRHSKASIVNNLLSTYESILT